MRYTNYSDIVLVRSRPEGAPIFNDGEYLGQTPKYVKVRRKFRNRLKLLPPKKFQLSSFLKGEEKTISIPTRYRWKESFAANLIFLGYAPFGWGIDLLTNTAWDMLDPPVVHFSDNSENEEKTTEEKLNSNHKILAIAPFKNDSADISWEVAQLVYPLLKQKYPNMLIIPPYQSIPIFNKYNYDHKNKANSVESKGIYYDLKCDYVLQGVLVKNVETQMFEFKGKLVDVYSGKHVDDHIYSFAPSQIPTIRERNENPWTNRIVSLLPNTLSVQSNTVETSFQIDSLEFHGESVASSGYFENALDFFSSISLESLEGPYLTEFWRWQWKLVTLFKFKRDRLKFPPLQGRPDLDLISHYTFNRQGIGGGVGGQISFLSKYGHFYFNLIPLFSLNQISYSVKSKQGNGGHINAWDWDLMVEFGFVYFINRHLNLQISIQEYREGATVWGRAFSSIVNSKVVVKGQFHAVSGIAMGYYFPNLPFEK